MSDTDVGNTADLEALKALQEDAQELERIENLHDRFNVFETIGFANDEVMHSNFLGFLLDPKRNDGLRDLFIKELLREALVSADKVSVPPVFEDLVGMDLGQTLMRREPYNIDILLTNETHRFALIIENKVWSTEHSSQLDRYDRIVRHIHPDWDILRIYLTPHGIDPTHKKYIPLSYGAVCDIVDSILEVEGSTLDPDVRMSMEHYVQMVRRKILGDPEIVSLSQQIYKKHKRAFDLIYKHRPDYQAQIRPVIEDLIRQDPKLKPDVSKKDNIKFVVRKWDKAPALRTAKDWTPSEHILIFEVWNNPDSLDLHLYIGPGPEAIRQGLLEVAGTKPEVFFVPRSTNGKWLSIFNRPLLTMEAYEDLNDEEREQELHRQWNEFLEQDLPQIEEALNKEAWIWESTEPNRV